MCRWLGLMIGNSRLHWAYCLQGNSEMHIQQTWDSPHLDVEVILDLQQTNNSSSAYLSLANDLPLALRHLLTAQQTIPLLMASVVPDQAQLWLRYPEIRAIALADIPLKNLYPTLGIDRALALLGAWQSHWQSHQTSSLVIDGGTALTVTGVDADGQLIGGAILPGLGLQLRSLHQHTASLPDIALNTFPSPPRWQTNTADAIASGVWYSLLAGIQDFIRDWLCQYPCSTIVFTGGDGEKLWSATKGAIALSHPNSTIIYDPHLIFKGMASINGNQMHFPEGVAKQ
ncbi:MAG: pantothenate kinase [Cyanobacteria bacterium P01_F01_bin.150]